MKPFPLHYLQAFVLYLGLRRKPSDGGIVERPFGTLNTQFFSTLPGYVSSGISTRSPAAESEACLNLLQLEQLLVRYIVDHYNVALDARMGDQSRIGRWEAGRIAQLHLMGDRELDICLMRRDRRTVYRSGYIQFANLTYLGEHLAAYAGEMVIIRYNPRDITTIFIYQIQDLKEVFLTRAHAQGWETETLSYREAQMISQRQREAGKAISNHSMLQEVQERDNTVKKLQRQKKKQHSADVFKISMAPDTGITNQKECDKELEIQVEEILVEPLAEVEIEKAKPKKPVPYVRVYEDFDQLRREANLL
jgi:putative transposase